MKLLIICPSYPPAATGEAEHCRQIAMRMVQAGHAVTVLTNVHPAPAPSPGFTVSATMKGWCWGDWPRLAAFLRSSDTDVILLLYTAWLFDNHPMVTFLPTWQRWFAGRKRLVVLFETAHGPSRDAFFTRLGRKLAALLAKGDEPHYRFGTLLRDANAVVTLGPTILEALSREHSELPCKSVIIPPPALIHARPASSASEREASRLALGTKPTDFLLAYFGYVYAGKGVETLLQAVHLLKAQGRPVRLVMAGGGRQGGASNGQHGSHTSHEIEMRVMAESLSIADRVVWPVGYGSDDDTIASQLMGADVAVLPFDDGAELRRSTIAVVASLGLPLITTKPSSVETAFVNGVNALLVPPKSPEALADAIKSVADDGVLAATLRAGALALARENFSWERLVRELNNLLEVVNADGPNCRRF